MKDTMTKKEFSAYTEELMGDILFRLKDNGGSMLKDTMDNIIEDIYDTPALKAHSFRGGMKTQTDASR